MTRETCRGFSNPVRRGPNFVTRFAHLRPLMAATDSRSERAGAVDKGAGRRAIRALRLTKDTPYRPLVAMLPREFAKYVADCDPGSAVVIVDESGCIRFANQELRRLFGYAPEDIQGRLVEWLVPERFRLPHIRYRLRFSDDRRARPMGRGQTFFICCRDGADCEVEIGLQSIRRGLETLTIAVIRPIDRQ